MSRSFSPKKGSTTFGLLRVDNSKGCSPGAKNMVCRNIKVSYDMSTAVPPNLNDVTNTPICRNAMPFLKCVCNRK